MKRLMFVAVVALVVVSGVSAAVVAQEERQYLDGKLRFGDDITVPSGQTVEGDLYAFGGRVDVDGLVTGDVIAFAGDVTVAGEIGGDLIVGSGTMNVSGTVGGDVRVGAGQATIGGEVGEDVLAGVGQLDVTGDVGGDLIFGAGLTSVPGRVAGDLLGQTGSYSLTGTVVGTADVTIRETEDVDPPNPFVRGLSRFASLLLIGFLMLWKGRPLFERTIAAIDQKPGPSALWGIGLLFGLVIVPLLATLVGVLLALLFGWLGLGLIVGLLVVAMVLTWVLVGVVAFVIIAVLAPLTAGTWLAGRVLPTMAAYFAMAAGIAALVVVGFVPVLDVLVGLAVTIWGGGAWLSTLRSGSRPAEVAVAP
jgi:hypothetical protein